MSALAPIGPGPGGPATWLALGGLDVAWLVPEAALAAVLVLGALVVALRRDGPAVPFAPGGLLGRGIPAPDGDARVGGGPLPRTARARLAGLPAVLTALALVAAVVALARPVRRETVVTEVPAADLVLCMDVSSSMTATDLDGRRPRLDVARDAALGFVRARPADRVGLVTFARWPDLQCPPTLDHRALEGILRGATTVAADGPEDATGLGAAVARAVRTLETGPARGKVVVLVTDGEENVALGTAPGEIAPLHAAQLCAARGVKVHAIVVGGPAPGRAPPDVGALEAMVARTGGELHRAADGAALDAAWARLDALERAPVATPEVVLVDRFRPWLVAAAALWVLARALRAAGLGAVP